ncbi:hypothetical protein ABW20_dc0103770 [Dactylellina cionopaga]|nr:hypothetical protein ABW20_dc0103770 [Dactylellina cionopaga]
MPRRLSVSQRPYHKPTTGQNEAPHESRQSAVENIPVETFDNEASPSSLSPTPTQISTPMSMPTSMPTPAPAPPRRNIGFYIMQCIRFIMVVRMFYIARYNPKLYNGVVTGVSVIFIGSSWGWESVMSRERADNVVGMLTLGTFALLLRQMIKAEKAGLPEEDRDYYGLHTSVLACYFDPAVYVPGALMGYRVIRRGARGEIRPPQLRNLAIFWSATAITGLSRPGTPWDCIWDCRPWVADLYKFYGRESLKSFGPLDFEPEMERWMCSEDGVCAAYANQI